MKTKGQKNKEEESKLTFNAAAFAKYELALGFKLQDKLPSVRRGNLRPSIHLFLISPVPACQSARTPAEEDLTRTEKISQTLKPGSYKVPTPQKPRDLGPVIISSGYNI